MTASTNSDYLAVQSVFANDQEMNEFGTGGGPIPDLDTDNDAEVPEVWFGLSDEQWQQLQESVEPSSGDGNHGVNLYVAALEVLDETS